MAQATRQRVLDSKGRPVPGLYRRGDQFIAGFKIDGSWRMQNLSAKDLSAARRERASLIAGVQEGRIATLRWADIDGDVIRVRNSATPAGTIKSTKTEAGNRSVPLDQQLRAILLEWRLASPRSLDTDHVVSTWNGNAVSETGVRKALAVASTGIEAEGRLSMHSLRHSYASNLVLAGVPVTTVALVIGHANPAVTLSIYARDQRSEAQVVAEVLAAVAR